MRKIVGFSFITIVFGISLSTLAQNQRKNGHAQIEKHTAVRVFPEYPKRSTPRNVSGPKFSSVPVRHDSLGNRVTEDHLSRVEFAHNRAEELMRRDPHVNDVVRGGRAKFVNVYRPEFERKGVLFNEHVQRYNLIVIEHPAVVNLWHRHFFFGGFYYGLHPLLEIDSYFYNPMVYWFYVPTFDESYYRNWYKADYDAYPELHRSFDYHGLYYPTDNLKQLLFGVSAMPAEKQAHFRSAISLFTKKLAQNMANALSTHVKLSKGDIFLTHYEIIGYDDAIVLEGSVLLGSRNYDFKGLLDLQDIPQTSAVAPISIDKEPTSQQLATLDDLNAKVDRLKGEPSTPPVDAAPVEQSPGEVTADPQP